MSFTSFIVEGEGNIPYAVEGVLRKWRIKFFGGTDGISYDSRANVSALIYDETDSLVRTMTGSGGTGGVISVIWDGKDDYDEFVPPGIYRIVVQWDEENFVSSINTYIYTSVVSQNYSGRNRVNQDYTDMGGACIHDGIAVPNVRVRAISSDLVIADEVHSDEDGNFVLYLIPGTYTIEFYKYNFERETSTVVVPDA